MRRDVVSILLLFALLAAVLFAFESCAPQARLNRLLQHHPELGDTVRKPVPVTVPGYTFTGSVPTVTSTATLDSLLRLYAADVDTAGRRTIVNEIHNHFLNSSCLDAPRTFTLPTGGTATVWQSNGKLYINVNQPPRIIHPVVPLVTFKQEIVYSWRMFAFGALAGWGALVALALFMHRKGGSA